MACSSSAASPCRAAPPMFKGDADGLVDDLVAACAAPRQMAASRPLRERELTPFSFEDAPPLPKAAARSPPQGRSPRASPPKQQKTSGSPGRSNKAAPSTASSSGRGSMDGRAAHRMPKQQPSAAHFQSLDDELVRVLRGSMPAQQLPASASKVSACPGFFTSPRPSDIPMPTMCLLGKATLVKA
ncbi:hypothetical protein HYH03_016029 [Edaphochlamys debaryana]|uniref:Uncharacterized protein n=1 Tax=Edaphochlamys debaryana TaxID=47281 RepID=A0A835XM10_9CHLO|nr:hypothetical protein HYH03_016029 [Edaphochlamys debaryana]|eukprot:KAG2485243.1 hypothetical protein HYH03_016029 [Edaphochlamys debaryana]